MYQALTFYHSLLRWLVVISLFIAVIRAYRGYSSNAVFSKKDNSLRHWTATIAHMQLMVGILLYSQSPAIKYFWQHTAQASKEWDMLFFSIIHITLMLAAIVLITVGSAIAKRKQQNRDKFKTMLILFGIALFIIFIAIPWPFSPLAARPYFR